MIETHCHLDYLKQLPTLEILNKCKESGVSKVITISVDPKNLDTVIDLSNTYENVYCSQGIHPHDAKEYGPLIKEKILENIKQKKVIAIGEIGLDYHYDNSPRDIQKKAFEDQLGIARDNDLPVIIHSREAENDTIEALSKYTDLLSKKGVIHSFTSKPELAQFALNHNFYIGFNGIITFKNAQELREIVKMVPIERILLETDSPFLAPVPKRGKENAPFNLIHIAEKIAEIKEIDLQEVIQQTTENALKLFTF